MQRFTFLAGLALAFLLSPALAQTPAPSSPVERVRIPGLGSVDYQHLFTTTSEPGESLDAFAARIAPRLRAYSDATHFEACGVLATDGQRFGVVVGTNRAHSACANFPDKVPEGMRAMVETIHSHGTDRPFRANRNDKALSPQLLAGVRGVAGQTLDAFSSMDYQGGPGYLATPGGVLHQDGEGTARQVAPLTAAL